MKNCTRALRVWAQTSSADSENSLVGGSVVAKRMMAEMAAVALVVGFLITQQIRTVSWLNRTAQLQEGKILSQLVAEADQGNANQEARVSAIQSRLRSLAPAPDVAQVNRQLESVLPLADLTPVKGSGIEVVMHDGSGNLFPGEPAALQLVHDQYVLRVIALISAMGARAISINGQRYTDITSIYCSGPTIRINGVPYSSPFIIEAVGPSSAMLHALAADPDIQGWSQLVFIHFHSRSRVEIAPYRGFFDLSLAKPVKIGG